MGLNVMKEFIAFDKRRIRECGKIVLESYFNRNVFEGMLESYIAVRYYDVYGDIKRSRKIGIINEHLEMIYKEMDSYRDDNGITLEFFGFVYYFDGISTRFSMDELCERIGKFRRDKLGLGMGFERSFRRVLNDGVKRFRAFRNGLRDERFYLSITGTNLDGVSSCFLEENVVIPSLYSVEAKRKVYNSGIVAENKLFVLYYMLSMRVLCDVIDFRLDDIYLVSIEKGLWEKREKLSRLMAILDDDLLKEKIVIMIDDFVFEKYRDLVCKFINEGYCFGLVLNSRNSSGFTSLFRFVYDSEKRLLRRV